MRLAGVIAGATFSAKFSISINKLLNKMMDSGIRPITYENNFIGLKGTSPTPSLFRSYPMY